MLLSSVLYGCEDQDIRGAKQCFALCFVWLWRSGYTWYKTVFLSSVLYGYEDQYIRGTKQCFCPLFCMAVKIRIYVIRNNALSSVLYGCEDQDIRGTKQCFVLCFVWLWSVFRCFKGRRNYKWLKTKCSGKYMNPRSVKKVGSLGYYVTRNL